MPLGPEVLGLPDLRLRDASMGPRNRDEMSLI